MGFNLQNVVPWGRSFAEYRAMFALSKQDLQQSMLGIGDGPAAFNAILTGQGGRIVSADPIYALSSEQIRRRIDDIYDNMVQQVATNADHLRLEQFGSAEKLGQTRKQAMNLFLQDYDQGKQQGRYLDVELPVLPFAQGQFDMALCSHLLFLYSDQLDLDFHIESILELCRVARQIRIFPLMNLSHQLSQHLEPVLEALATAGFCAHIEQVDYEFQTGANQMLRIQADKSLPLNKQTL